MELFVVDSFEDIHNAINKGDTQITDLMFKAIKRGVKRNFKQVKLFEVVLRDDPEWAYDWIVEKVDYKLMLENCLSRYTETEEYEKCVEVQEVLRQL